MSHTTGDGGRCPVDLLNSEASVSGGNTFGLGKIDRLCFLYLTIALWLYDRRRHTENKINSIPRQPKSGTAIPRAALSQLKDACNNNDPRAATQALLAWGNAIWPDNAPRTLPALAARLSDANVRRAILGLDSLLYCDKPPEWNGRDALMVLTSGLKLPDHAQTKPEDLPPLYPAQERF